jgi:hypothetical protein
MSEAVGYSLSHLIVDQALPLGRRDKMSMHTFLPDAVNTSDKKVPGAICGLGLVVGVFLQYTLLVSVLALKTDCLLAVIEGDNLQTRLGFQIMKIFPITSSPMNALLGGCTLQMILALVGTRDPAPDKRG